MQRIFTFILFFSALFFHFINSQSFGSQEGTTYPRNPYIEISLWDELTPYFLPYDHPIREKLDELFSQSRITLNAETVKAAGFTTPEHRNVSLTIVSKHPKLKGFLVKLFTDDQDILEWDEFLYRIEGAHLAHELIEKFGYERFFNVPEKWIYPLPSEPSPPEGSYRKNFILVVEDMHVLRGEKGRARWRSSAVTKQFLHSLYNILESGGFADCVIGSNLPFSKKDGRVVFVDTEDYYWWPINYSKLLRYLSKENQEYWKELTQSAKLSNELH